ncbi:MAG: phosphoribosyl-ATP diphosphatase [Spirochaetes bacterium]|nr:phosphoribosyl-ATP diphosphatase [Spirochaetota bacterium]MBX3723848.1 phosphoribosyl-ATP diphosphatase [Turneriella sp.]
MNLEFLAKLEGLLQERFKNRPEGSYTTKLYESGPQKILQKVGEEAIEYILDAQFAAQNGIRADGKPLDLVSQAADKQKAIYEGADLIYHFMVSLVAQGWSLSDIVAELEKRHAPKGG